MTDVLRVPEDVRWGSHAPSVPCDLILLMRWPVNEREENWIEDVLRPRLRSQGRIVVAEAY